MIKERKCLYLVCDKCGIESEESYVTRDMLEDRAFEDDSWLEKDGKHYCNNCARYDDELCEVVLCEDLE